MSNLSTFTEDKLQTSWGPGKR